MIFNRRLLLALGAFVLINTFFVGLSEELLLVMTNALYALWLLRQVGHTHAKPED